MKKKLIALFVVKIVLALLCMSMFGCAGSSDGGSAGMLTVYNCEDYIDESIFEDFSDWYQERYGKKITINYVTYDTNETMLTKVLNDDADVDVICTSEYAIQKLYNKKHLLPIEKTEGMNTINSAIYERTASRFGDDFTNYFVPYMYGTLGILYNADVMEENGIDVTEEGWGLLWNSPHCSALNGKILMKDSIRDTFAAGVLYLKEQGRLPEGYEEYTSEMLINCTDEALIAAVKEVLIEQKSELKGYEVDFGKDDLISLHAYVDLAWSGDAMYAIEEAEEYDVNLDFFVPESGANIWFDGWFIPTCSANPAAATAFIEFMCKPDISTRNMIEVGYTSAVDISVLMGDDDVLALLEDAEYDADDFFSWEVRYPNVDNPAYGMMTDYGDANTKMTIMWEEVKAATPENSTPVWLASLIALAVIAGVAGVFALLYTGLSNRAKYVLKK